MANRRLNRLQPPDPNAHRVTRAEARARALRLLVDPILRVLTEREQCFATVQPGRGELEYRIARVGDGGELHPSPEGGPIGLLVMIDPAGDGPARFDDPLLDIAIAPTANLVLRDADRASTDDLRKAGEALAETARRTGALVVVAATRGAQAAAAWEVALRSLYSPDSAQVH